MDLNTVLSKVESIIESNSEKEIESVLREYNRENSQTFNFDPKEEEKRKKLCEELIRILGKNVQASCQTMCLETLRILSRDKKVLGPVATKQGMLVLAQLAALQGTGESVPEILEVELVVEALKCLCNVIFNSVAAQQLSAEINLASGLCARLRMYTSQGLSHEVALFSLRLLFLLSALRTDVRSCLRQELKAVDLLIEILEHILSIKWVGKYEVATDLEAPPLPLEDNERAMEALKTLFNLTLTDFNDEDGAHQLRLITAIMRHVLMIKTQTEDKTEELHSHAINLLSNIPVLCLGVMISVQSQGGIEEYSGKNMDVIQVLLDFMVKRIDKGSNFKEGLTPVFSLMTESARHHRDIRKYIKAQVLPPLKDVKNRPEVGTTVRNKLVRLMTHVDTGVKQSAAEFLFVLCKESVDNLLKYTGYGNAAGLLAARGLLAGGRGGGQYSEDEDSDTEEYKSVKPFINPITGHVEEPMPNPIEEMTEEQKEYEALKLVNMFDQLSRQQIIQPMGVKQDGTIAPLAEAISQCNIESCSSDSD
ncbi:synembryn-B-like [Acipenser oxyrinchus oxyrinchus]|uniref:Synembryn n=1 Tax=Acipenser oxyrinchus oxyrinchus TaxID=40147 RepID=A0AAD8DFH9_ACIOX|nr:synembryn-B-like [Acipenser oxyrinchus oxyrinchus]